MSGCLSAEAGVRAGMEGFDRSAIMDLIERDEAAVRLDDLLAAAIAGRGRVALVTGTVATGKSELLAALADRSMELSALAVTATGSAMEKDMPLALLSQLFHDA